MNPRPARGTWYLIQQNPLKTRHFQHLKPRFVHTKTALDALGRGGNLHFAVSAMQHGRRIIDSEIARTPFMGIPEQSERNTKQGEGTPKKDC